MTAELLEDGSFCSRASRESGEPLAGTATRALVWLLLEVPRPWGAKAYEESRLSRAVKERLSAWLGAIPAARLQFIKRGGRRDPGSLAFAVALAAEDGPALYEFHLRTYDDLLALDVPGLLADPDSPGRSDIQEPLFLVCTNGRRDPCCGRFGLPVYRAARRYAGGRAWQTSHVGGHRFAPNLVCLPQGACYGRVAADEVEAILDSHRQDRVHLDRYRGRSCYTPVVQAAEAHLRAQTGILDLDAFRLQEASESAPDRWQVDFTAATDGAVHRMDLVVELTDVQIALGCRGDKTKPLVRYRLEDYKGRAAS
jgi:hypothetical protein